MLEVVSWRARERWNALVSTFKDCDAYSLASYAEAFRLHGDGEPRLFYGEEDGVRAFNVVMTRDVASDPKFSGKLPQGKYFDLATPYGYGGWIVEGEGAFEPIFRAYEAYCVEHGIVSEFARFHPILRNAERVAAYYEPQTLGPVVALDLESPEIVWKNMIDKCRCAVNKARKSGLEIVQDDSEEAYRVFKEIYDQTMIADGARDYYFFNDEFYASVRRDLGAAAKLFLARLPDGATIAAAIMLLCNDKMNYHLSASLRGDYGRLGATNFILYSAAVWGAERGYKTLYLGGGVGAREDALFKFKKSFYRRELEYSFQIGRKIFDRDAYRTLLELRGDVDDPNFFPAYRG